MKKFDFKKLALMGITGGVICATQVNADTTTEMPKVVTDTKTVAPGTAKIDEAHFLMRLDPEHKAMYIKLSPEGKALALKLANADGTKPAEFQDANDAVKAAHKRMAEQHSKRDTAPVKY